MMRAVLASLVLLGATALAADVPICGTAHAAGCCKICKKGKACGDACIAVDLKCTKGAGCACNG